MADSLKTGMGAIYRERRHSSARREFSQWFTADWRLLTEGRNKINTVHIGNGWWSSNKAIRKCSVWRSVVTSWQRVTWSGICWCSLAAVQVTDVFCQGQEETHLGQAGGWGAERMAKAEPISGPLNGQLVYLPERSGSEPVLLNTLQGWSYGGFLPREDFGA